MKGTLIALCLAPGLVLADTARIATWNLGGFHQIPQNPLEHIIDGLRTLGSMQTSSFCRS